MRMPGKRKGHRNINKERDNNATGRQRERGRETLIRYSMREIKQHRDHKKGREGAREGGRGLDEQLQVSWSLCS